MSDKSLSITEFIKSQQPERRFVPLADIISDSEIQPRAELDGAIVADYAAAMREGDEFPPLKVFEIPGESKLILVDGFHRYAAYKLVGKRKVDVDVYEGDRRTAQLFALGANAKNGMRLVTNADKRRAVRIILGDDEWKGINDHAIGRYIGVSQPFVRKVRMELAEELGEEVPETRLVERNGVMFEVKIGNRKNRGSSGGSGSSTRQLETTDFPGNDQDDEEEDKVTFPVGSVAENEADEEDDEEINIEQDLFSGEIDKTQYETELAELEDIKLGDRWQFSSKQRLIYQLFTKINLKVDDYDHIIYAGRNIDELIKRAHKLFDICGCLSVIVRSGADLVEIITSLDLAIAGMNVCSVNSSGIVVVTYSDVVIDYTPIETNDYGIFFSSLFSEAIDKNDRALVIDPGYKILAPCERINRDITVSQGNLKLVKEELIGWNRLHKDEDRAIKL